MKASLYCRTSKNPSFGSVEEQQFRLLHHLEEKGYELYAIYVDNTTLSYPPSFIRLLQDASIPSFDVILCVAPDLFYNESSLFQQDLALPFLNSEVQLEFLL